MTVKRAGAVGAEGSSRSRLVLGTTMCFNTRVALTWAGAHPAGGRANMTPSTGRTGEGPWQIHSGSTQGSRTLPSLTPGRSLIDERALAEALNGSMQFARSSSGRVMAVRNDTGVEPRAQPGQRYRETRSYKPHRFSLVSLRSTSSEARVERGDARKR